MAGENVPSLLLGELIANGNIMTALSFGRTSSSLEQLFGVTSVLQNLNFSASTTTTFNCIMRAIIKRVATAVITVKSDVVSAIDRGLCIFTGVEKGDTADDMEYIIRKILEARLFGSECAEIMKNVVESNLEVLCVNQPNIIAYSTGKKPDLEAFMKDGDAENFYSKFLEKLYESYQKDKVQGGVSAEYMQVHMESDSSVLVTLDSRNR